MLTELKLLRERLLVLVLLPRMLLVLELLLELLLVLGLLPALPKTDELDPLPIT